jgi:predicted regulator of Ras-like GTPase activity (Roadblock/LC7/MglB family)
MTAEQALEELLDVSEDVTGAVIFDRGGEVLAASGGEEEARSAAETAGAMLAYADSLRTEATTQRIEAVTREGGVFVVREGERAIVAATGDDPVTGLVLHDLRAALRKVAGKKRARAKAAS